MINARAVNRSARRSSSPHVPRQRIGVDPDAPGGPAERQQLVGDGLPDADRPRAFGFDEQVADHTEARPSRSVSTSTVAEADHRVVDRADDDARVDAGSSSARKPRIERFGAGLPRRPQARRRVMSELGAQRSRELDDDGKIGRSGRAGRFHGVPLSASCSILPRIVRR